MASDLGKDALSALDMQGREGKTVQTKRQLNSSLLLHRTKENICVMLFSISIM